MRNRYDVPPGELTLPKDANLGYVRLADATTNKGKKRKIVKLSQARERAREMLREASYDDLRWSGCVVICWHQYSGEYSCHFANSSDYRRDSVVETIG